MVIFVIIYRYCIYQSLQLINYNLNYSLSYYRCSTLKNKEEIININYIIVISIDVKCIDSLIMIVIVKKEITILCFNNQKLRNRSFVDVGG